MSQRRPEGRRSKIILYPLIGTTDAEVGAAQAERSRWLFFVFKHQPPTAALDVFRILEKIESYNSGEPNFYLQQAALLLLQVQAQYPYETVYTFSRPLGSVQEAVERDFQQALDMRFTLPRKQLESAQIYPFLSEELGLLQAILQQNRNSSSQNPV